jgi:hypothetical protein
MYIQISDKNMYAHIRKTIIAHLCLYIWRNIKRFFLLANPTSHNNEFLIIVTYTGDF